MLKEILILLEPIAKYGTFAILIFDIAGLVFLGVERFGTFLGIKGQLARGLASILLPVFGTFKTSLKELTQWHVKEKREEKLRALGKQPGSGEKHPFSYWMVEDIVRNYENNAQGIAYLGAACLIFVIGLRGIRIINDGNKWFIIFALALEFTLIGLLGLLLFYKPEDEKPRGTSEAMLADLSKLKTELELKNKSLEDLQTKVQLSIKQIEETKLAGLETRVRQSIQEIKVDVDALRTACEASKKTAGTP